MILLNEPWSHHERLEQQERRHEAARRALLMAIYAAAWVSLGIGIGFLFRVNS